MNFLAHAYLSRDEPATLAGNFAGDFIKGRQALEELAPDIRRGVLLHRAIDEYTDQHAVVYDSKRRLRPRYRHYAGVIVDIIYDHFLAVHWSQFHPAPLAVFVDGVYDTLRQYRRALPERFNLMLAYMISGNWLVHYRELQGIRSAFTGMASRSAYASGMETAADDLQKYYEPFRKEFLQFFPQLEAFSDDWRRENPAPAETDSID